MTRHTNPETTHHVMLLALLVPLALGGAGSAVAETVSWTLVEPECQDAAPALVVPCGAYGVFHFESVEPSSCQPLAGGAEDPPSYGSPGTFSVFPFAPVMLLGATAQQPAQQTTRQSAQRAGHAGAGARVASTRLASAPPLGADLQATGSAGASGAGTALDVVLDFSGPHGASTTWLVDVVSGAGADAVLLLLDDPELAALGPEVGDFHVLAGLCRVVDEIDRGRIAPPRTINMSFGRTVLAADASSAADCLDSRASCQIARVAGRLRGLGTRLVAAAGNHGEPLFPAWLEDVGAVGMLEMNSFLDHGAAKPAWQTPPNADAWTPGNGLCLRHWPAPAGASYSSALFAGWVSSVVAHKPGFDPLQGGPWFPAWSDTYDCFVLSNGDEHVPVCNRRIGLVVDGLAGGNVSVCWLAAEEPTGPGGSPGEPGAPPAIPSLASWSAQTSPTPESDPCVPCVARFSSIVPEDVRIDMSQSKALPPVMLLDDVRLQVGAANYALNLTPTQLSQIAQGQLAELTLPGWGPTLTPAGPVSLWYQFKPDAGTECSVPGACFWSSTPVLFSPVP